MLRPWEFNLNIFENYSAVPIYLQISAGIINAIELKNLRRGDALPGTRTLASSLNVSRNTVIEAYSRLEQEGWIFSVPQGGTFVSHSLPKNILSDDEKYQGTASNNIFDQGLPDARHSPILDVMREYRRIASKIHQGKITLKTDPLGYIRLRVKLSQMLSQQRRIHSDENNICITRGSQMGIFLLSQCLFKKGDHVIVEHPGYRLAWDAFEYSGANVITAEVDDDGIIVSDVKRILQQKKNIKAVYITPNSQFPTTAVLSEARRRELIELSNEYNFFIIEDDYCIDLNYEVPLFPLCSSNRLKNYFYIGTFSRSVSPLLKIGYVVGHYGLIDQIKNLRKVIDISGDMIMEAALFNLIQDGVFSRHIKRYTQFYKEKRDQVDLLLKKYLNDKVRYHKPKLGLGYWITPIKQSENYNDIIEELISKDIMIINSGYYKVSGHGFYLSFGSADLEKLEIGIKIIGEYL